MKNNDNFFELFDKIKGIIGDTNLIQNFACQIINYFIFEYFIDDYDMNNLEKDMYEIASSLLTHEKYKSLNKLNKEDMKLFISSCIDNIDFLVDYNIHQHNKKKKHEK